MGVLPVRIYKHWFGIFLIFLAAASTLGLLDVGLISLIESGTAESYIVLWIAVVAVLSVVTVAVIQIWVYSLSYIEQTADGLVIKNWVTLFISRNESLEGVRVSRSTAAKGGVFGQLLNYGTISLETNGGSVQSKITMIPRPEYWQAQINLIDVPQPGTHGTAGQQRSAEGPANGRRGATTAGKFHGMTWPALHISRSVDADVETVALIAGDPRNLPLWAAGLSAGIRLESGRWYTNSPMGVVEVAFTGPTEAGILDHDVTLPDGTIVQNPLRVIRNDTGSEIVFTLFQRTGMTDEEFRADARLVEKDLTRLAELLQRK